MYEADAASLISLALPVHRPVARGDELRDTAAADASVGTVLNPELTLLTVTKRSSGFDADQIGSLTHLVRSVPSGRFGAIKFLVFDFAHGEEGGSREDGAAPSPTATDPFDRLVSEVADLILEAPVISIAWVRGPLGGRDLDLALACSMIVAEPGARFTFATDSQDGLRSYAILAHKIGFAHAERLLEAGAVLSAPEMLERLLVKEIVPNVRGLAAVERFVAARARRHNSSYGIYRAQRIARGGI